MAKMGRPKKPIDYALVEKLANIMATQEEISTILEISVRTLQNDEEFLRVHKKGQEDGKMSLRRHQFKLAENNTAMAIFLGKNYLGQADVQRKEISTPDPVKVNLENVSDTELKSLLKDIEKVIGDDD